MHVLRAFRPSETKPACLSSGLKPQQVKTQTLQKTELAFDFGATGLVISQERKST